MTAVRSTTRSVDEMLRSRHVLPGRGDVESAVRVAGGFPTLGGGARWGSRKRVGGAAAGERLGATASARRDLDWTVA
jgi:hypothetical protein